MAKKWPGSTRCSFCGDDVRQHETFFDATTRFGHWALMCDNCFFINGQGRIGVGRGQKYDGKTLEKIGG